MTADDGLEPSKQVRQYRINANGSNQHSVDAAEMREGPHYLDFVAANGVTVLRIRHELVDTVEANPNVTTGSDGVINIQS
jgi:hypothetical protein